MKIIFFLILIASCTTWTPKKCRENSWPVQGFEDAQRGLVAKEQIAQYQKACGADFKEEEKYQAEYNKALEKFCTFDYGMTFGENGNNYHNTCVDKQEHEFLKGYLAGLKIYFANQRAWTAQQNSYFYNNFYYTRYQQRLFWLENNIKK